MLHSTCRSYRIYLSGHETIMIKGRDIVSGGTGAGLGVRVREARRRGMLHWRGQRLECLDEFDGADLRSRQFSDGPLAPAASNSSVFSLAVGSAAVTGASPMRAALQPAATRSSMGVPPSTPRRPQGGLSYALRHVEDRLRHLPSRSSSRASLLRHGWEAYTGCLPG